MKVFQYGSNMSKQRMESRVGSVTDLGLAELPMYKLAFGIHSTSNNCAVADMEEGVGKVVGRVYDITDEQRRRLDGVEGVRSGNYRPRFVIVPNFGDALTYVGTDQARQRFSAHHRDETPSKEYLGHLIDGLEDPAMRATLPYISHVIGLGRPNLIFQHFTADPTFDNRSDYRRSTVGMSSFLRGSLKVKPGDFVLAKKGATGEQLHLVVQKLPEELLEEDRSGTVRPFQIATISREAREILGVEATGERRNRKKFRTVYEPVDFYPIR